MPSIPFNPFPRKTIIIPDDAYIDKILELMKRVDTPSNSRFFCLKDPKNNSFKFYDIFFYNEKPFPYFIAKYGRIGKPERIFDSRDKDKTPSFNAIWNLYQKKCIEKINKGYTEVDRSAQYDIT